MKKILAIVLSILFIILHSTKSFAYSYGVGKISNHERPDIGSIKEIITSNNGYYIGKDTKEIYLTFDCGYENGYTGQILDTLKEEEVNACFFITGHYLTSSTDLVKRMITDGHIIGNHTNKHKHFTKESTSEMLNDIKELEVMYNNLTGLVLSNFVRPPAGEFKEESLSVLSSNGYKSIFWSLAYVDWYKDKFNGNGYSYKNVMEKIHNGAIILMHTVSKDNMVDLKNILVDLKKEGYIFKSLYDL